MSFRKSVLPLLLFAVVAHAQTAVKSIEPSGAARSPNTQQIYAQLRSDLPGTEGVSVKEFILEREGARYYFEQGDFYFYQPVNGRVTGAVFVGKGIFHLSTRNEDESRSLSLLTRSNSMTQLFSTLVLRFTDGTDADIRKASKGASVAPGEQVSDAAKDLAKSFRNTMHENLDLRLLADVIGGSEDGGRFFLSTFRMTNPRAARNVMYIVDPEGTFHTSPDEVEMSTWNDVELQPWVSSLMQQADEDDLGPRVQISDQRLDVTLDRTGTIKGSAETTMKVLRNGVRVVRLDLYPSLRVSGVYSENGTPLDFVQEDKDRDPDFAVILPATVNAGDTLRLLTTYSGSEALLADGNATFYLTPEARKNWYPSDVGELGQAATFHMIFRVPQELQIVATGKLTAPAVSESNGLTKTVWETDVPVTAVGFSLGNFKESDVRSISGDSTVDAYANIGLPDRFISMEKTNTVGNLSTLPALKNELSQGNYAFETYTNYFGKLPYDHLSLMQQSRCTQGEDWPMLVTLPICGFMSTSIQMQLGLLDYDSTYWNDETPHEVSHLWWGDLVRFRGYRDQWMNEAFANYSVGVYLGHGSSKMDDYREFWAEQQKNLLQKNAQGARPIDIGPLTMGYRGMDQKTSETDRLLNYSKGAYVLHMLDMLYWSIQDQDASFKEAMQQFVKKYAGKAASTEDLKESLEQNMPKWMDLRGDGKLDWFFDEWVYGTELPHYTISSDFTVGPGGVTSVHLKLTQSNVTSNFVMRVPLYLELKDGEVARMFSVVIHGNDTVDQTIPLNKLSSPAKTMLLNYNSDVLCDSVN